VRRFVTWLAVASFAQGFSFSERISGRLKRTRNCLVDKPCSEFPLWMADQENGRKQEPYSENLSRRKRCVDYPDFAFERNERPKKMIKVRYQQQKQATQTDDGNLQQEQENTMDNLQESNEKSDGGLWSLWQSPSPGGDNTTLPESEWWWPIGGSAKRTRYLDGRSYARAEPFRNENIEKPPQLSDLSPPIASLSKSYWINTPTTLACFGIAYLVFPYIVQFLDHFVTMEPAQLDEITSRFGPGISILYGTFVSLTLSILYKRQQDIQENVASESSLLILITRNLLSLFHNEPCLAVEAGQCAADQVRTMVRSGRGSELLLLMYSDPYARMLELIDVYEDKVIQQGKPGIGVKGSLPAICRDCLKDLHKIRASRLSDESLALPPTHFFILTLLTCLILLGYTISILPAIDELGRCSNESSLLFGVLSTVYILFYNFARDLNEPFDGVYQVRRSAAASHLLETKWLLANHPLLKGKIEFDQAPGEPNESGSVVVRSPGLGDMVFEEEEMREKPDVS